MQTQLVVVAKVLAIVRMAYRFGYMIPTWRKREDGDYMQQVADALATLRFSGRRR